MKYCAKCGNPMEDDMMFCQKCGTKFEGVITPVLSDIDAKIEKMKKYNLVLDAESITWEYLREDGERAGNITTKQDKLCVELVELLKDILSNVSDDERDLVEREVYTFVLQMGYKMCKEAEKMYANYAGFKELFDMGNQLCMRGQLDSSTFLNQMIQQDMVYKIIASLQGLHTYRMKEVLDEDVIRNNMEFREMTKHLAEAYNSMWYRCIKRHTDFYISPGQDLVNQNWDMYTEVLKGLPLSVIERLDEKGWMLALDDAVKNHNEIQFKRDFLRKREEQREAQRKKEQEIADKQYWESHPDEYKQLEENKKKIAEICTMVDAVDKEIRSLENEKRPLDEKKKNIEASISDKKQSIEKLGKKIFGKKKATEEIQVLDGEVSKLNEELQTLCDQIKMAEKPISDKKTEKNNLEREIRDIEQENIKLRSK